MVVMLFSLATFVVAICTTASAVGDLGTDKSDSIKIKGMMNLQADNVNNGDRVSSSFVPKDLSFIHLNKKTSFSNVTFDHRSLIINGDRKLLISGAIHYPRSVSFKRSCRLLNS